MRAGSAYGTDRRHDESRDQSSATPKHLLIRDAALIFEKAGIRVSPSKISRLVAVYKRDAERAGFDFIDYLSSVAPELKDQQHTVRVANGQTVREVRAYQPGHQTVESVVRGNGRAETLSPEDAAEVAELWDTTERRWHASDRDRRSANG